MLNKLFPLISTSIENKTKNTQVLPENIEDYASKENLPRFQAANANGETNIFSAQNYMSNPVKTVNDNIFEAGRSSYNPDILNNDEFVPSTKVPKTQDIDNVQNTQGISYSNPVEHVKNQWVNKNGEIETIHQAEDKGNCWLLSAVNSLKWTDEGRKILDELIDVKDGYTTFHFGAENAKINIDVTDEEVAYARNNFQDKYSKGDDDMIALEIGVEKYLNAVKYNENTPSYIKDLQNGSDKSSIDSGNFEKALYILAGKAGTIFKTNAIIKDGQSQKGINGIEEALNTYKNNSSNSQIMNASISKGKAVSLTNLKQGEEIILKDEHQYAVKNISDEDITIVDPWNSEEEIKISLDDFKNTFTQIEYADLCNLADNRSYNV